MFIVISLILFLSKILRSTTKLCHLLDDNGERARDGGRARLEARLGARFGASFGARFGARFGGLCVLGLSDLFALWPTGSRRKNRLISGNTRTIRSIGIHGAMKHSKKQRGKINRSFFPSDIQRVTGATLWNGRYLRTRQLQI